MAHWTHPETNAIYADTQFINDVKPHGILKHLGYGDFVLEKPDNRAVLIEFLRTGDDIKIPNQSGRCHLVLGDGGPDGCAADWLRELMKLADVEEEYAQQPEAT